MAIAEIFRKRPTKKSELPHTPDVLSRLEARFPNVKFLKDPNGSFSINPETGNTFYAENLREQLTIRDGKTYLGDIYIPDNLRSENVPAHYKVGISLAGIGLGHERIGRALNILCQTLKIPSEIIDVTGHGAFIFGFFRELKEYYRIGSRNTGKLNGMAHELSDEDVSREESESFFSKVLFPLWKRLDPEGFVKITKGEMVAQSPASLQFKLDVAALFAKSYITFLGKHEVTHNLVVYPFLAMLLQKNKKLFRQIAPDSVVIGLAYPKPVTLMHHIAKWIHAETAAMKQKGEITVSHGYPSPIGALINKTELLKQRSEKIKKGEPLTLILPASGVATAQSKSFADIITNCQDELHAGSLRVIVQTGFGKEGNALYKILNKLIQEKSLYDFVVLHWAKDAEAAVDFFEAITSSDMPIAQVVKGSELACMAIETGLPHIVTGAIGLHEYWNIITAILQGSPVVLLPEAYKQMYEFVDKLSDEKYRVLKAMVHRAIAPYKETNQKKALNIVIEKTIENIRNQVHAPQINTHMMIDEISALLAVPYEKPIGRQGLLFQKSA